MVVAKIVGLSQLILSGEKSLIFSQFLVDAGGLAAIVLKGSPDEEIAVR